jgi:hypothetical protein
MKLVIRTKDENIEFQPGFLSCGSTRTGRGYVTDINHDGSVLMTHDVEKAFEFPKGFLGYFVKKYPRFEVVNVEMITKETPVSLAFLS